MTIDWAWIETLEGSRLNGYVPDPEGSVSGVTIASGVDLGHMGEPVLASLPPDIRELLMPYLGLKKQDAVNALIAHPLIVTQFQADTINAAARAPIVHNLAAHYIQVADHDFYQIPDAAQTVCASVSFQYGAPWIRCPKF